jgi:hypothetical protein
MLPVRKAQKIIIGEIELDAILAEALRKLAKS